MVQYTYLIGNDDSEAMLNYNIYLKSLDMRTDIKVTINDNTAIITKNGIMISAMTAGYDEEKGYILIVIFKESGIRFNN